MSCSCCVQCAAMAPDPLALLRGRALASEIGDLLPKVVTAEDVVRYKARLHVTMQTTDVAVTACASMTPEEKSAWKGFYSSWVAFKNLGAGCFFGCANEYDAVKVFEQQLIGWQDQIRGKCNVPGPPPPGPDPFGETQQAASIVKYVAIAGVVVAGAYLLSPVVARLVSK